MRKTEPIKLSKVKEDLHTEMVGHCILYFRELTSTNCIARELADRRAKEGTAVLAEIQTHGHGRLGRKWISPTGGIWLSIVLYPRIEIRHAPKLTMLGSLAVAHVLKESYGLKPEVKWPNDVLISRRKICGILTEARTKGNMFDYAILGLGINANFSLDALPVYVQDSSTTLNHELGRLIRRESLLVRLLEKIEHYYKPFNEGRSDSVLEEWRRLATFFGSHVKIMNPGEKIEGHAVDIDYDGALLVRLQNNTIRKVIAGDLRIVE